MTQLRATRGAQYELTAEFIFNLADTMTDVNGVVTGFKNAAGVFEPIKLPNNAVVTGGDMTVETASNESGTATIKIGDKNVDNRYLAATNLKAAGRTALTLTGYRGVGEDIRITMANQNGDATAGKVSLRVKYIITGRVNEAQTN